MTKTPKFQLLAYKAYKNGKLAALDAILTAWEDSTAARHRGQLYPYALHMRHIYNGLIALDNDDVATAKMELIKASMLPRSIMFRIFGPNLMLADRLLKRGEQKIVLRFLKNARKFWSLPFRLYASRHWRSTILRGEIPNWEDHLYFYMRFEKDELPVLMPE